VPLENQAGSPDRTGQRDRHREVAPTFGEQEALLDHHIEEMLVAFSDLAPGHEDAERPIE
jgi:hypothetical protein